MITHKTMPLMAIILYLMIMTMILLKMDDRIKYEKLILTKKRQ